MPNLVVIAGPDGAGKSTAAPALLRDVLGITEFVNADTIAQGLSAFAPEAAAVAAGRLMLNRMSELAEARVDFAFETTLASRSFAPWIAKLREAGWTFHLMFLWLPSAEFAVRRVAERVRSGGHFVPVETVCRRYERGLRNFFELYQPLADRWHVFDNSRHRVPRLVAQNESGTAEEILDAATWRQIQSQVSRA